jgi:hypothetical protein
MLRLVRAICTLLPRTPGQAVAAAQLRNALFPVLHLLLQCLVMPGIFFKLFLLKRRACFCFFDLILRFLGI